MVLKYKLNSLDLKTLMLFAIAAALLLSGLNTNPIYIKDEAKNAQCAREMHKRNDLLIPTFNGRLRSDKPPFPYFAMYASYKLFGVNPFASRFFSAICGMLTLFLVYHISKKYLNKETALISVCLLLSSFHFLFEFRMAVPDPYLIFFTTSTILSYFLYTQNNRWIYLLICAVTAAAGFLSKGPIALILPLIALFIWSLWDRKMHFLFSIKTTFCILFSFVLIVPWFLKIHQETNGLYTHDFFITNNVNRFNDTMEGHSGNAFSIILFVVVGMLPATLFIEYPIRNLIKHSTPSLIKLSVSCVLVIIGFFCFSNTKLPNYPMPSYPFIAIIIAYGIQQAQAALHKIYIWVAFLIISSLNPVSVFFLLGNIPETKELKYWASLLLILPISVIVLLLVKNKLSPNLILYCLFSCFFFFNFAFYNVVYPKILVRNPVIRTSSQWNSQEQLYAYQMYNPGFNFYLDKPILILKDSISLFNTLTEDPKRKVITRLKLYENLDTSKLLLLASYPDLFESPTTVIFKLKPKDCPN